MIPKHKNHISNTSVEDKNKCKDNKEGLNNISISKIFERYKNNNLGQRKS